MMTLVMGGLLPIPKPAVTTRCSTGPLCGSAKQNKLHFTFYIYINIFIHSMKSFWQFILWICFSTSKGIWLEKCIIYGICTFWTQKRCIPWQEQILHIQGITSENVVLSLKKFLISVLWDFVVLILRDLIHRLIIAWFWGSGALWQHRTAFEIVVSFLWLEPVAVGSL